MAKTLSEVSNYRFYPFEVGGEKFDVWASSVHEAGLIASRAYAYTIEAGQKPISLTLEQAVRICQRRPQE